MEDRKSIVLAQVTSAKNGAFAPRPTSREQDSCNLQELADVNKAPLEDVLVIVERLIADGLVTMGPGTSWNTRTVELVA